MVFVALFHPSSVRGHHGPIDVAAAPELSVSGAAADETLPGNKSELLTQVHARLYRILCREIKTCE